MEYSLVFCVLNKYLNWLTNVTSLSEEGELFEIFLPFHLNWKAV